MKKTLLIVDDDETIRLMVKDLLSAEFDITDCGTVDEGLACLTQTRFDMVVSDWEIGKLRFGSEIVTQARRLNPHQPVVVMSGRPESEIRNGCGIHQPNGFVSKPFRLNELLDAIQQAQEGKAEIAV